MDFVLTKVDGFFDFLEAKVDQMGTLNQLNGSIGKDESRDSKSKDADNSTQVRWAQERLKNGGAGSKTRLSTKGKHQTVHRTGDVQFMRNSENLA